MKKTIIQMWGAQGCGKSGTIKILREELIAHFIDSSHTYTLPLVNPHDIHDVLKFKGLKLGIESMGDYLNMYGLKHRLDDYCQKHNCDLIVCASRVYNDVAKHIKYLADNQGYRLIKVTNFRGDKAHFTSNQLTTLNHRSAIQLLNLVDDLINGVI